KSGDLLKVDVGVYFQGLHTDAARTMGVGKISAAAQKIMSVTEESFWEGIKCLKEGAKLSSYSKQVQKYIEKNGLAVVRNLVGHGVGKEIHEDPYVPNFYNRKYEDLVLKSGMTLALEPMVNAGGFETVLGHDGWIFKSKDGSLTAHYENTVVITKEGVEVLTI
ncbi:type I methionyl aminopeptidase, partial [Patescibacteria group bacterium]